MTSLGSLDALFFRFITSPAADDEDDEVVFDELFSHNMQSILDIKHNRDRIYFGNRLGVHLQEHRSNHSLFFAKHLVFRRLGYILRQNKTVERLTMGGEAIFAGERHATPGLWLCVGLQCNESIKELTLLHIDLKGPNAMHALAPFITDNPVLEKLALHCCKLEPMDIWQLSYSLMYRPPNTLRELSLDGNSVGDNCMQMLVLGVLHNRGIKRLSLARTEASGKAIHSLSGLLAKNESTLEELDLSGNSMDTCDALKLLRSLETNDKLETMNLKGNPLCWEIILHRLLRLVCDALSFSAPPLSNHTISSILEPRMERMKEISRFQGKPHPMKDLCHSSLDEDGASLLFASIDLNHKMGSVSVKARHKTMWRLVRGDLIASEAFIDIGLMPRVLALLGRGYTSATHCESCQKASAKLVQYQDEFEAHPLDAIRLGTVYRAVRAWPELCFAKDTALQACQRKLACAEAENERLRLELKKLRSQIHA